MIEFRRVVNDERVVRDVLKIPLITVKGVG
jgi:hypothetical protein